MVPMQSHNIEMQLGDLVSTLETVVEGAGDNETVEVEIVVARDALDGLKGRVRVEKELEQMRTELEEQRCGVMKPSVARQLNNKITSLEAELEQLRSNMKVKDLEKKIQFLEAELKHSYATKNFSVRNGLLELEKLYRHHIDENPDMAALWADVTVLLDEKKERDTAFKGPSGRQGAGSASSSQRGSEAGTPSSAAALANGSTGGSFAATAAEKREAAGNGSTLLSHPSTGVQATLEVFKERIDAAAEAAAAEATLNTARSLKGSLGGSFDKEREARHENLAAMAAANSAAGKGKEEEEAAPQVDVAQLAASVEAKAKTFAPCQLRASWAGGSSAAEPGSSNGAAGGSTGPLSCLFQEFLLQLEEQGLFPCAAVADGGASAAAVAAAVAAGALTVPQVVELFSSFLEVNKDVLLVHQLLTGSGPQGTTTAASGLAAEPAAAAIALGGEAADAVADPAPAAAGTAEAGTSTVVREAAEAGTMTPTPEQVEVATQAGAGTELVHAEQQTEAQARASEQADGAGAAPAAAPAEAVAAAAEAGGAAVAAVGTEAAPAAAASKEDGSESTAKKSAVSSEIEEGPIDRDVVIKELSSLRIRNSDLAAQLQSSQALVEKLNASMIEAVNRADDRDVQLVSANRRLNKLLEEHAEVTRVLIEAKVEIAEGKGELLKLVRSLKRALATEANMTTKLQDLQDILAAATEKADKPESPLSTSSGSSKVGGATGGPQGLFGRFSRTRTAAVNAGAAGPGGEKVGEMAAREGSGSGEGLAGEGAAVTAAVAVAEEEGSVLQGADEAEGRAEGKPEGRVSAFGADEDGEAAAKS